jgi:glycosyltransferase involved in cell wall biosynthesis
MGLPILSSNLPNISSFILKHSLGIVIKSKNITDYKKAVHLINKNKKLYSKSKIIKEQYSWKKQESKFLDIIKGV